MAEPVISRIFEGILSRSLVPHIRELVISPPAKSGPETGPNNSSKENLGRIKLDLGHLLIWGAVSAVISFLIGVGANSFRRGVEYQNLIGPNTLLFYMTYSNCN